MHSEEKSLPARFVVSVLVLRCALFARPSELVTTLNNIEVFKQRKIVFLQQIVKSPSESRSLLSAIVLDIHASKSVSLSLLISTPVGRLPSKLTLF